jgi:pimeloyl-ACP methyl ester carboxylesterase
MSAIGRAGKVAGLASAVLGAAAVAGYGFTRASARRIRAHVDDPDAERLLEEPIWVSRTIPSFDGGTINVVDREPDPDAERKPVTFVLSHGVVLSVRTWLRQLDALPAAGYRTIAFDHRGHGGSQLGRAGHSVANLAEDFRAVLEELDLHDAVLVGHSMGGIAVQSFVMAHPEIAKERVGGIVLLSSLAKTIGGSHAAQINQFTERVIRRTPDTTRIWAAPNFGLMLTRMGFGRDPRPSQVELVRRMMADCDWETRTAAPRSLIGFDLTEGLDRISLPTLIICGTHDAITPVWESQAMQRAIPGARLELLDGGGHMLMLERTAEVDRLLIDFAHEVAPASDLH